MIGAIKKTDKEIIREQSQIILNKIKQIAELEKENAEYKEVFGSCGTCKRSCDIGNCCDPRTKSSYLLDKVKVIVERQKLLKENTELKEENKVLAQNLEDTEIVNKALEKENAELKAFKEKCKFNVSDIFKDIETENNLTKAKEIISEWEDSFCRGADYLYLGNKGGELRIKSQKFLNSEVEK